MYCYWSKVNAPAVLPAWAVGFGAVSDREVLLVQVKSNRSCPRKVAVFMN